jgi:lipopolysaccharide heptosyltransferase I
MAADCPRILITRLSAIGDCILTLPVASAIKAQLPEARISWLVGCAARQLLAHCPDIDEVISVPGDWLRHPGQVLSLRRRLRAAKFDFVVDPQSRLKSSPAGWLSGARLRVGFASPRGRELSTWLNNRLVDSQCTHLVDAQLDLLKAIDLQKPTTARFRLDVPRPVQQWAAGQLAAMGLNGSFAVINPGGTWLSKCWPVSRFGTVARRLRELGQHSLVVWGNPAELDMARQIVVDSGGTAVLGPSTDLVQLAAILQRADVCIAGDTGPLHLAAALGTPCVGIYGPTDPRRCGPYGKSHIALWAGQTATGPRQARQTEMRFIEAISCDAVVGAAQEILTVARPAVA